MKMTGRYGFVGGAVCLFLSLFLLAAAPIVYASNYPNHAISLVVPYAPGGTTDTCARALAESLEKYLKQPVVIQSKPGGGTTIGGNAVASARPDGYTIGMLSPSSYVSELLGVTFKVPYTSYDLKPISGVVDVPMGILVRGDAPWNNIKDLVEYTRKNPGVKIAVLGKNNSSNYIMIGLAKQEKISFVTVPFDGGSKMVPPLLGGHVAVGITGMDPSIKSLIDAKKIKVLAIALNKRIDILPNVPCFEELGYKIHFIFTVGVFGPKGTPDEVVRKIDDTVRKVAQEKDFQTRVYNTTGQLNYQDSATYEKNLFRYRDYLNTFMKEEGFLR